MHVCIQIEMKISKVVNVVNVKCQARRNISFAVHLVYYLLLIEINLNFKTFFYNSRKREKVMEKILNNF